MWTRRKEVSARCEFTIHFQTKRMNNQDQGTKENSFKYVLLKWWRYLESYQWKWRSRCILLLKLLLLWSWKDNKNHSKSIRKRKTSEPGFLRSRFDLSKELLKRLASSSNVGRCSGSSSSQQDFIISILHSFNAFHRYWSFVHIWRMIFERRKWGD